MKFPFQCGLARVDARTNGLTYTEIKIGVKELERAFLIHRAHAVLLPFVSDAHRAQLDRRDADT